MDFNVVNQAYILQVEENCPYLSRGLTSKLLWSLSGAIMVFVDLEVPVIFPFRNKPLIQPDRKFSGCRGPVPESHEVPTKGACHVHERGHKPKGCVRPY